MVKLDKKFKLEPEYSGLVSDEQECFDLPWVGIDIKRRDGNLCFEFCEVDLQEMAVKVDDFQTPENYLINLEFQSDETRVRITISLDAARKLIEALKEIALQNPVTQ